MKQIIQSFKTGDTILEDVPVPKVGAGQVLIRTSHSLVSLGTERMLVEFGKASLIQKARQQPDKVKMVLDKIKADGFLPTLETVFKKLGEPLPLGYCNVGRVIEVGKGVKDFKKGDRVASNGAHAEVVCVPQNLVAHVPENVTDEEAAFTVIGSIGLQGIRLLNPSLGETVVVTGLGLIGLLTAQLLKANGCKVIGLDLDNVKIELARSFGVECCNSAEEDPVKFVEQRTNGVGADGVIITASAKSDKIISQAANMARKRGKIILIGVIGLNLNRSEFYEKELTFQVSCSYGPGRYDHNYEQKGHDYPLAFVRWTEKRNFESVLSAISEKQIDVNSLISEVERLEDFQRIYKEIGSSKSIASLLKYDTTSDLSSTVVINHDRPFLPGNKMAVIGAGNFTKMTMLPLLDKGNIKYLVSKNGLSSKVLASKYDIDFSTTDFNKVLADPDVTTVVITTRHNLHASMTLEALRSGKNVFVEKPLAILKEDLEKIQLIKEQTGLHVIVGYNRRFSPHIQKMKSLLPKGSAKNLIATMNAGKIPSNVWVHDMDVGGGRILGEACHYFDLLMYLSGSPIKSVCMNALGNHPLENTDNVSILLKFENGDNGVINYFANGNKSYSKERVEVYFDECNLIMDNFRTTEGYGLKGFSKLKTKQNKGHREQFSRLTSLVKTGGEVLIPFDEIMNSSLASFAALESLKTNSWIDVQ